MNARAQNVFNECMYFYACTLHMYNSHSQNCFSDTNFSYYEAAVSIAFWSLLVAMLYLWGWVEVVSRASLVWLPLSVA